MSRSIALYRRPRPGSSTPGGSILCACRARATPSISWLPSTRSAPGFRRWHGATKSYPVAYFDGPGGTQVPDAGRRPDDGLPAAPQRQHALALPDQPRDRRGARRRPPGAGRLPQRVAERDRLRQQHDDDDFPRRRARLGRGWGSGDEIVVTELDHHANVAPWRALARERGVTRPHRALRRGDGPARLGRSRARRRAEDAAARDGRGVERARHDQRRRARRRAGARAGRPDVRRRRALRAARAGGRPGARLRSAGVLGLQVLRPARRRAVRPRESLLARLDVPKLDPAPDTAPERLETGTQNHEGIVGAGAAVDFLASLAEDDRASRARAALEASFAELHARGQALVTTLYDGLPRHSRRDASMGRRPIARARRPSRSS